ncbi:MAG: phosphoenolpyruvate carboxykinase (GTP), partial [Xanthomonadales bacterium]|nr:phosphoenolpyruvate carboxykinase (GTP) [Xanthomonadales bacterium]
KLPRIFHVNWFRKDADGHFLWPGFGDNLRVLEWMLKRIDGSAEGHDTPIGVVPAAGEINTDGLNLADGAMQTLLAIDSEGWKGELAAIGEYLDSYGAHTPARLKAEQQRVAAALDAAANP